VSALAVHHLGPSGKAELFSRVASVLSDGGAFILADVVIPDDSSDAVTPIDGVHDTPSRAEDQVRWLEDAGLRASIAWRHRDLVIIVATSAR